VRLRISHAHAVSLDTIIAAVEEAGGPRFSRDQLLETLIEAAEGRTLEPARVKSLADLRVAFGGIDLSRVEKLLKERPRMETGLLKALEETIK